MLFNCTLTDRQNILSENNRDMPLYLLNVCLQIVEGYGQTECTAPVTLTVQGDHVPEHVGPPVACCKVKVCYCRY